MRQHCIKTIIQLVALYIKSKKMVALYIKSQKMKLLIIRNFRYMKSFSFKSKNLP